MDKNIGENVGSVKIADDVVAMIAAIAATEVDGVREMYSGNIPSELMSRVGVNKLSRGVKVNVCGKKVHVELAVVVEYGYNIQTLSEKVQNRVKTEIGNMTELEVVDVNVTIAGVHIPQNR